MDENGRERKRIAGGNPVTAAALDLRGKQSVRATFRLSPRAIETISVVAVQLGIKQKSLFDHLMEDSGALGLIAREIQNKRLSRKECVQKTYVLSRRTLQLLEQAAREYGAPRDALVEFSIKRLLPIVEEEQEKHSRRKEILAEMKHQLRAGMELLRRSEAILGEEDLVTGKLASAVASFSAAFKHIEAFVERGSGLEEFLEE